MSKKILVILLAFFLSIWIIYYNATKINTKQIKVRQEILKSDKIDQDINDLLIIYFSDLYYGEYIDEIYLNDLISKINIFKPDIIIFGGDLIQQNTNQELLTNSLSTLQAKHGKFAVVGDNDGLLAQEILNNAGFDIIDNDNRIIAIDKNSYITIVGSQPMVNGKPDLAKSFSGINSNYYTIYTSHCPDIFDDVIDYPFDIMLAGHSLGGQIHIPIIEIFYRPQGCQKYHHGKITNNTKTLDITNGLGRIDYNARLLADSEIVLYTLKSK